MTLDMLQKIHTERIYEEIPFFTEGEVRSFCSALKGALPNLASLKSVVEMP